MYTTNIHAFRLTRSTLGVPVLRYRCYMVSKLLVVVMRGRRALPAQTFRSLQTAGRRRKKPLMCWRCWGAPGQEEDRKTEKVLQKMYFILYFNTVTFLTASNCEYVFALSCKLTLFYSIKWQPGAEAERGGERVNSLAVSHLYRWGRR